MLVQTLFQYSTEYQSHRTVARSIFRTARSSKKKATKTQNLLKVSWGRDTGESSRCGRQGRVTSALEALMYLMAAVHSVLEPKWNILNG